MTKKQNFSDKFKAAVTLEAVGVAIAKYSKPEIMNTDHRSQYTGAGWITTLSKTGIKISMPRGDCMQSFAGNR